MGNFIQEAVKAQDEQKRKHGLPRAKYTLVVQMTANSHDELADMVHSLDVNWIYECRERDEIDSTDGRTSVLLTHPNPEQTPEKYTAELREWSKRRRRRHERALQEPTS